MIIPRIEHLSDKIIIGKSLKMSYSKNTTFQLWSSFMPKKSSILNTVSNDLYSIQIYPESVDFKQFNPMIEFEKWAGIEVSSVECIPLEMDILELQGGLYAVFDYKGLNTDTSIFEYIFGIWLPNSGYQLDHRPHFEVLGNKYKNNDLESEEEIWIPIIK